jgi:hypothetical protein
MDWEESTEGNVVGEGNKKSVISSEQMDVEAYGSLYSGRTKIMRLIFIADHCGNESMRMEALRMAYDEIKKGDNTQLFKEVAHKIGGKLGSDYALDQDWIDSVERRAEQRKDKLENELNGYKVIPSSYLFMFRCFLLSLCGKVTLPQSDNMTMQCSRLLFIFRQTFSSPIRRYCNAISQASILSKSKLA